MARTENDSWDLASSVGATATGVAASRAMASRGDDALLADPLAEPLVRAVGVDVFNRMLDGELAAVDDPLFNPQAMNEQIAVRTRYYDDFLTEATAAGVRQAVILAAGLDTRAYRLDWPAGTVVYEVDQPEVIGFKTRTLADLDAAPTAEHRTVGIDLRADWPTALRDAGFDPTLPTAWIAEGLLVYLPPEAQDRLFDNITGLSAPGSRLATEHIPSTISFTDERAKELTARWQKLGMNIDMSELIYDGDRNIVTDYLAGHGWQVIARPARELYDANGFVFPEDDVMAALGEMSYVSATLTQE